MVDSALVDSEKPRQSLKDRLVDPAPNPEQRLLAGERLAKLRQALVTLPPEDQTLLIRRYGLDDTERPWTLPELARSLRTTPAKLSRRLVGLLAQLEEQLRCVK